MKIIYAIAAVALVSIGCGESHGAQAGSQTHFLERCSSDCPAPYSCLCGVCSLSCSADSMCKQEAPAAQCLDSASASGGSCDDAPRACDVDCAASADCAALGAGFSCVSGRCRVATQIAADAGKGPTPVDGGMSATAGRGAGTGGAESMAKDASVSSDAANDAQVINGDAGTSTVLCDGSDDMRLGLAIGGGFVSIAYAFTNPYGFRFAFVDGHCNYWASNDYLQGVVTGTLSESEAVQLTTDVGWSRLDALSYPDAPCPDSGNTQILRPGVGTYCSCGCDDAAPQGLASAIDAANTWMNTLVMKGTPLSGAVKALAYHTDGSGGADYSTPWPLTPSMFETVDLIAPEGGTAVGALFPAAADAETLRGLRAMVLPLERMGQDFFGVQQDQMPFQLFIRDELPEGVDARITALIKSAPLPQP